jgi:nucleolar complex protein 2
MKRSPKPTTLKALDFSTAIRAGKSLLGTRVYQDGVGEQVVELFSEFFTIWCKSIAFPELALPVIVMLKRWLKDATNRSSGNKNTKVNSAINLLVQKLEANSTWVEQKRIKVDFAPNNRSGVEHFLKEVEWHQTLLGAYVKTQRKLKEEKDKLLEEGRDERNSKGSGGPHNGNRANGADHDTSSDEEMVVNDSD